MSYYSFQVHFLKLHRGRSEIFLKMNTHMHKYTKKKKKTSKNQRQMNFVIEENLNYLILRGLLINEKFNPFLRM